MLHLITAAIDTPVGLDEVKGHLRIDGSDEDGDVELKMQAAIGAVEQFTGPLIASTWEYKADRFEPGCALFLPVRKLVSVDSVTYQPETGAAVTLVENTDYYVDLKGSAPGMPGHPRILAGRNGWPTATLRPGGAITVEIIAGYDSREDVPATVRDAILLEAGNLYRNRESIVMEGQVPRELDRGVRHLLMNHTIHISGWVA